MHIVFREGKGAGGEACIQIGISHRFVPLENNFGLFFQKSRQKRPLHVWFPTHMKYQIYYLPTYPHGLRAHPHSMGHPLTTLTSKEKYREGSSKVNVNKEGRGGISQNFNMGEGLKMTENCQRSLWMVPDEKQRLDTHPSWNLSWLFMDLMVSIIKSVWVQKITISRIGFWIIRQLLPIIKEMLSRSSFSEELVLNHLSWSLWKVDDSNDAY